MSTTDTSLEQRIAALEDRAAISELLARFCLYADQRRWEELSPSTPRTASST